MKAQSEESQSGKGREEGPEEELALPGGKVDIGVAVQYDQHDGERRGGGVKSF